MGMKIYDSGLVHQDQVRIAIDADLKQFIKTWQSGYDDGSRDAIDAYCQIILRGGKRLRGILAMQSYYAHGGTDDRVAVGVARALEMVQAYLLVLDDIADRSDMRRGGLSAHRLIEQSATVAGMRGDKAHYGVAQAMNVAQAGLHEAAQQLLDLPVTPAISRAIMRSFHKSIEITSIGQMNDIFNEATTVVLEEVAIERVLTQKSAYYTFVNPLELGACLAGAKGLDAALHTYALRTGCAFQITDDLIGTFGEDVQTGKSTNDDIREGKMTLIAQYALAHSEPDAHETLRRVLGNAKASDAECEEARLIMRVSGAEAYAIARRDWHVDEASRVLKNQNQIDPEFVAYLIELTSYAASRTS